MKVRTEGVLLVLLLLLSGASTQATCEVRCALGARMLNCHASMATGRSAAHSSAVHASGVHCGGMERSGGKMVCPEASRCCADSCADTSSMPTSTADYETSQAYGSFVIPLPVQIDAVTRAELPNQYDGTRLNAPRRSTSIGPLAGRLRV